MIRAWLIDLVREAVRAENLAWQAEFDRRIVEGCDDAVSLRSGMEVRDNPIHASNPSTELLDPSFEQLQDAALYELEKYHEERNQGHQAIA